MIKQIVTIEKAIEILKQEKDYEKLIEIKYFKAKRTIPQNSYLHLIFNYIAVNTDTWYDADELKEIFKSKFLWRYSEKFWEYVKPTSKLTKEEMIKFIEEIKIFCLEFFRLEIPNAEDKRMLDFYNNYSF